MFFFWKIDPYHLYWILFYLNVYEKKMISRHYIVIPMKQTQPNGERVFENIWWTFFKFVGNNGGVFFHFIWMYFFNGMKFTKENKSKRMKKMKIIIASKILQQLIIRMWCFSFKFNGSIPLIHLCQMQFKWHQREKLLFTFFLKKKWSLFTLLMIRTQPSVDRSHETRSIDCIVNNDKALGWPRIRWCRNCPKQCN